MNETTSNIGTLDEHLKPGTITLYGGASKAGKSTLAFRIGEKVAKQEDVLIVWDEKNSIEVSKNRLKREQVMTDAPARKLQYVHERIWLPDLSLLDLAEAGLLIIGHHYGLRDLAAVLPSLKKAQRDNPKLAILLLDGFPPHVARTLQDLRPEQWHELFLQRASEAGRKLIESVNSLAIIKPKDGWTYRRTTEDPHPGVQTVHFLKPKCERVMIPKPMGSA